MFTKEKVIEVLERKIEVWEQIISEDQLPNIEGHDKWREGRLEGYRDLLGDIIKGRLG
jgi:hypothetical protein